MNPANLSIVDFTYNLPNEKIAMHPLAKRDASKLLVYKEGQIEETVFSKISSLLPGNSLLVMNNTRVINARMLFKKNTGAVIELFCLEPAGVVTEYQTVMKSTGGCQWKCLVGGASKWKEPYLLKSIVVDGKAVQLKATLLGKEGECYLVAFSWEPASLSFAEIITAAGLVPLPPYIKRSTEQADANRYQTVFARQEGSVAAPTAGLHFTAALLDEMAQKKIDNTLLTLHVGAGTFKPVKAAQMREHQMHAEYMDVSRDAIVQLQKNVGSISAVGTTACRSIETLYWLGVKAHLHPQATQLSLQQWDVYEQPLAGSTLSAHQALDALLCWMDAKELHHIFTQTQLMIAPGYGFKLVNRLITNFHQPQSTLLLLVAAAIGNDWQKMYRYALEHEFRFLSYGDANLIFIPSV